VAAAGGAGADSSEPHHGRTDKSGRPTVAKRRLPVIVVFHSASLSSSLASSSRVQLHEQQFTVDDDADEAGALTKSGPNDSSQPADAFSHHNANQDGGRPKRNVAHQPPAAGHKANSLVTHLELARLTKSIVITFNHRIGLLGKSSLSVAFWH
jgi:hypothetical protein